MEDQRRAYATAVSRRKVTTKTTENDILLALLKEASSFSSAKEKGDSMYVHKALWELASTRKEEYILSCESLDYFFKLYKNDILGTKADELADIVIICHTLAEFLGIDLKLAVKQKMRYNELREDNLKTQ